MKVFEDPVPSWPLLIIITVALLRSTILITYLKGATEIPSQRRVAEMPTAWAQEQSSESGSCVLNSSVASTSLFTFPPPHNSTPSPQRVLVAPPYFNKTSCSPWGPKSCVFANTDKSINVPYQCWDCWQVPQSKRDCDSTSSPPPPPDTHSCLFLLFLRFHYLTDLHSNKNRSCWLTQIQVEAHIREAVLTKLCEIKSFLLMSLCPVVWAFSSARILQKSSLCHLIVTTWYPVL